MVDNNNVWFINYTIHYGKNEPFYNTTNRSLRWYILDDIPPTNIRANVRFAANYGVVRRAASGARLRLFCCCKNCKIFGVKN